MTAGRRRPKWKWADCPVCDELVRVRQDGCLSFHYRKAPPWGTCSGSSKPPAQHVHRCDCGARWSEELEEMYR